MEYLYHMRHVCNPNARTVHLLYAHAVTIAPMHFTPTHFNLVQRVAHDKKKKKTRGEAGTTGISMVLFMGVNLYTFVGARAPTMPQMGTHNSFWAPTKIIEAPTRVLLLGHPQ